VSILIAWGALFLSLRHIAEKRIWNSFDTDLAILTITYALSLAKIHFPKASWSRAGIIVKRLLLIPFIGLALTIFSDLLLPSGHPSLAGIIWIYSGLLNLVLLPIILCLLYRSWMQDDNKLRILLALSILLPTCLFTFVGLSSLNF